MVNRKSRWGTGVAAITEKTGIAVVATITDIITVASVATIADITAIASAVTVADITTIVSAVVKITKIIAYVSVKKEIRYKVLVGGKTLLFTKGFPTEKHHHHQPHPPHPHAQHAPHAHPTTTADADVDTSIKG